MASTIDISSPEDLIPSLRRNGKSLDIVFNCLHGGIGEDGTIQALLEILKIPYTGSPILANVLAMNKLKSKEKFQLEGIPTPPYLKLPGEIEWTKLKEKAISEVGFPLVIKPVSEGSSLGVRILQSPNRFEKICEEIQSEYGNFLIEEYIPGVEVTAGILRKDAQDTALPLVELRTTPEFYNYKAKYTPGMTEFIVPAELDDKITEKIKGLALKTHQALGCFGFSRVDFRVNPPNGIFVLEVNTVPGMTRTSDLPKAAYEASIEFDLLVEYMLKTVYKTGEID